MQQIQTQAPTMSMRFVRRRTESEIYASVHQHEPRMYSEAKKHCSGACRRCNEAWEAEKAKK